MQEPQPLGCHLLVQKIDAGRISAGPGEAGYKTKPDRVIANAKDDRNSSRLQLLPPVRGRYLPWPSPSANQIGYQSR
jgi:hypothetical protein